MVVVIDILELMLGLLLVGCVGDWGGGVDGVGGGCGDACWGCCVVVAVANGGVEAVVLFLDL